MKMQIERTTVGAKATIGKLRIFDDSNKVIFECYTLENKIEGPESGKDLRIPQGQYKVYWRISPSKGKKVHVYNNIVPKERYIMFHAGNKEEDTLGCILLGLKAQIDYLWQSRDAVSAFEKILSTQNLDNIPLEIVNHISITQ